MPTKRTTRQRIVPVSQSTFGRLRDLDFPAEIWKGLFLVTWNRLAIAHPAWADFTAEQVLDFWHSHLFCYQRKDTPTARRWIAAALKEMQTCPLPDGRGRKKPDAHPHASLYLRHYTQIKRYFDEHQSATQGTDAEIRALSRRILDRLGLVGRKAEVTDRLVDMVRRYSSADLAYEILYHVYGVRPAYLEKKVFPKLRKSASVLDQWERELTASPLFE